MNIKQIHGALQPPPFSAPGQAPRGAGLEHGPASGQALDAWADARFALWSRSALEGSSPCALAMMEDARRMRGLMDGWAARGPAAPDALANFAAGGVPRSEPELAARYAALPSKDGRQDFKAELAAMERAILGGSPGALAQLLDRSPMALWALDLSLSQYEGGCALAFCAKHAPPGADVAMAALLRSLGAAFGPGRVELGGAVAGAGGAPKSAAQCGAALLASGYEFNFADGLMLLSSSFDAPGAAAQALGWLDWIEGQGLVDWRAGVEEGAARGLLAQLRDPLPGRGTGLQPDGFLAWAQGQGRAGLGAWMGLRAGPAPGSAHGEGWALAGSWLCDRGLAAEALACARFAGDALAQQALLPWAERQELRLQGGEAPAPSRALRI